MKLVASGHVHNQTAITIDLFICSDHGSVIASMILP